MKLIVFEGLDGSGKTSTLNGVMNIFKNMNYKIYYSYEPSDPFGRMAKFGEHGVTSSQSMFLWWLARVREQQKYKNLDVNIVFKDRYYDSTYVYQNLEGSAKEFNFDSSYFYKPDLTILLDIEPQLALARKLALNPTVDLHETDDLVVLEKRREQFLEIVKQQKNQRRFAIIDTSQPMDSVIGLAVHYILRVCEPTHFSEIVPNESLSNSE